MRFKSIKMRTMVLILPILITTLSAILIFSYYFSKSQIENEIENNMGNQLLSVTNRVMVNLTASSKVAEVIARDIEYTWPKHPALDYYQNRLISALPANEDIFGLGVFFEPYHYKPNAKYFSTYAYHGKEQIIVTEELNDPKVDYPNQDWYQMGLKSKEVLFSDTYADENTNYVLMSTAGVPFYDQQKKLLGFVSVDLDLTKIQKFISETKVGNTGWVFLLDSKGMYISGRGNNRVMKENIKQDKNTSLASISNILLSQSSGSAHFEDTNGINRIYFKKIPQTTWVLAVVIPEAELLSPLEKLLNTLLFISIVAIFIVIVVIFFYSRYITRNIHKVNDLAESVANGDYTQTMEVQNTDEFGQMAGHLNAMITNSRKMIHEISHHSHRVAATAEQLTASAEQTNKATEQVTQAIQEVSSGANIQVMGVLESKRAMEEISLGIQRIVESSLTIAERSTELTNEAKGGNGLIQRVIQQMTEIQSSVGETAAVIHLLEERSKNIDQIINVMSGITEQTNLLSLNATIEAARVGEHGKAFSVVANEVRKLSEESQKSAQQVSNIIQDIQKQTALAVITMRKGSEDVDTGSIMIHEAGQMFENILDRVENINENLQEVSASSQEMSVSYEEVEASVEQFLHIAKDALINTQNVAASSEEQLASMEQISYSTKLLNEMASELKELIGKFKV